MKIYLFEKEKKKKKKTWGARITVALSQIRRNRSPNTDLRRTAVIVKAVTPSVDPPLFLRFPTESQ